MLAKEQEKRKIESVSSCAVRRGELNYGKHKPLILHDMDEIY